jgi:hypothetical protein
MCKVLLTTVSLTLVLGYTLLAQGRAFPGQIDFRVEDDPRAVAAADLNGDKLLDLAVANYGSNNVSILLSVDGRFKVGKPIDAGKTPISVAVGDFNQDEVPDLAVANYESNGVSILMGVGEGGFKLFDVFAVGARPYAVAVGDFNGDGRLDLATANELSNNVSVLLGNGDGTFQEARNFGVGRQLREVTVGGSIGVADFNGDDVLDLAVANFADHTLAILLGNGDGTFQSAQFFGTGNNPAAVTVGDFNGDGRLDLAVANFGGSITILGNIGSKEQLMFSRLPIEILDAKGPVSIVTLDFDLDGLLDLAIINHLSDNAVVFFGDGKGQFEQRRYRGRYDYGVYCQPTFAVAGEFNLVIVGQGQRGLARLAVAGTYPEDCFLDGSRTGGRSLSGGAEIAQGGTGGISPTCVPPWQP